MGGTVQKDMFRGLGSSTTWALVSVGNLQAVEMAQQPAVASPQSEEGCLLVSLELVDWISTTLCIQSSLPLGPEMIVDDGLGLPVGYWVAELLHFAACLGESISVLITLDPKVRWNPLECNDCLS